MNPRLNCAVYVSLYRNSETLAQASRGLSAIARLSCLILDLFFSPISQQRVYTVS